VPNAVNIAIFSNDEREIIGTMYKNNQIQAYQEGFAIYNKKVTTFLEQFDKFSKERTMIVYCWRGGMRSKTIAELLESKGFKTLQLDNGYKKYREMVREELTRYAPPFELIVLQGMAGIGKTDIIKEIKPSIDLEGLAQHRSSLFGSLGLKPQTQKMFETKLWSKLQELKDEKIVFIEGEAKKIGNIFVPTKLFEVMESSKTILIQISIEKRAKRIVRDYFTHGEDEEIKKIITKLKVHLSNKTVEELCKLVDEQEYETVSKVLLEEYYDKQYSFALQNKTYYKKINNKSVEETIIELNKLTE
jgi:tRNA 2-selenouridine synthase